MMRKANEYIKNKSDTDVYVKLSDVHREFGLWCKAHSDELKDVDSISKKYFHYIVNLLPAIELNESDYPEVNFENNKIVKRKSY